MGSEPFFFGTRERAEPGALDIERRVTGKGASIENLLWYDWTSEKGIYLVLPPKAELDFFAGVRSGGP